MTLSFDSVLSVAPGCLSTRVDNEMALMPQGGGEYCGLDPVGANIMERILAEPIRFGDLLDGLCRDFAGQPSVIEADTRALIGQLVEHGLVEVRN